MRPERRRGMNVVMVGQERRTSEAFLVLWPVREVEVNGDTLPPKPQYHSGDATKVSRDPYWFSIQHMRFPYVEG